MVDGLSLERCQQRPEFLLPRPASHEGAGEVPVARATLKVQFFLRGKHKWSNKKRESIIPQLHSGYVNQLRSARVV